MNASSSPDLYRQLDDDINSRLGIDLGFTALIRTTPYSMDEAVVERYRARHALITRFQERTLALFKASLKGEREPEIADMILGDVPPYLGIEYHRRLTDRQHRVPVFFRTDEPVPGVLSEIQCPGSGWCLAEEILTLYRGNPGLYGPDVHFPDSPAVGFANALRTHLGKPPVVHHLTENASRPHGMRYFIQRTREEGIKYFTYDRGVTPNDCNFVRSHDYITLPHHNFFTDRMERCERGEVTFDLSPSAVFDNKAILSWPFWRTTRDWYDDQVRALFPFTNVIRTDGFELPSGEHVSLDGFCGLPPSKRNYYVKYAGSDIALNWGSKAVFLARTLSAPRCRDLMKAVAQDSQRGRYWILQENVGHKEQVSALGRDGSPFDAMAYSKFSGFYGPRGLIAVLVMQKPFHKVHGSTETIMSLVR